jgi:hypothetical protein
MHGTTCPDARDRARWRLSKCHEAWDSECLDAKKFAPSPREYHKARQDPLSTITITWLASYLLNGLAIACSGSVVTHS